LGDLVKDFEKGKKRQGGIHEKRRTAIIERHSDQNATPEGRGAGLGARR